MYESLIVDAQAMGYHPAAIRQFAEWSGRRMIKAGVKLKYQCDALPPYRSTATDSKPKAIAVLLDWRDTGRSITMQNSGDGVCPMYDGMRAAARINLLEMQQEECEELVAKAKTLLAMMTLCPSTNTPMAMFLEGRQTAVAQLAPKMPSDEGICSRLDSSADITTRDVFHILERHALITVDGDHLAMHQLMACAVRAELEIHMPASLPGVDDMRVLLTAWYGTEDDEQVHAVDYEVFRSMGHAVEHVLSCIYEIVKKRNCDSDLHLVYWMCGMLLRSAVVQENVTHDTSSMERLLSVAKECVERLRSMCASGADSGKLEDLEWRLHLYQASVKGIKGDFKGQLELLEKLEADKAHASNVLLKAATQHHLGSVYESFKKIGTAVKCYESALSMYGELPGHDVDMATELNNIGNACRHYDHLTAVSCLNTALDIFTQELGPLHPHVAVALNNLGNEFHDARMYDEAMDYYIRAREIQIRTLGLRHPEVATTQSNIGQTCLQKGDRATALQCFRNSMEIFEEKFGSQHSKVAELAAVVSQLQTMMAQANDGTH
jgi:tetratricopeptide (TPR) repeat protein